MPDELHRLCTRVGRCDATRRSAEPGDGTGLALSTVESIGRLQRGKVSAVSGTFGIRFSLLLPSESGSDSTSRA